MKQIILINNCTFEEYERIKTEIDKGLNSGKDRFTVCGTMGQIVEIEIIELPDVKEQPTIIHNTTIGMDKNEFELAVSKLLLKATDNG